MKIIGTNGRDMLAGSPENDMIKGRGRNDAIDAGNGDDLVYGGRGNDVLIGGTGGDDVLFGGRGRDNLIGDSGDDVYVGGSGRDVFHFLVSDVGYGVTSVSGFDRVLDFKPGKDRLFIHADGDLDPSMFAAAYDPQTGIVSVSNGDSIKDVALLKKGLSLHDGDLAIVA